MQVEITGHHLDLTDALKDYVNSKCERFNRHFDHLIDMQVVLSVEKLENKAEGRLHVSGNTLFAEASHENMYAAIDALADKLDRQVLKHKEKTRSHHQREVTHHEMVS